MASWLYMYFMYCILHILSTLLIILYCAAVDIRSKQSLSSQMWQKIMKRGRRHHLSSPVCSANRLIGKWWIKNTLRWPHCKLPMVIKVVHRCWLLASIDLNEYKGKLYKQTNYLLTLARLKHFDAYTGLWGRCLHDHQNVEYSMSSNQTKVNKWFDSCW